MMVEESLLTIGLFCWLFLRVARENEERQALLDYAGQHGMALDERRAARAVAAGRGDELWERLPAARRGVGRRGTAHAEHAPAPRLSRCYFAAVERKLTSAVISFWLSVLPKLDGITPGVVAGRDVGVGLDDRGVDALLERRAADPACDCGVAQSLAQPRVEVRARRCRSCRRRRACDSCRTRRPR